MPIIYVTSSKKMNFAIPCLPKKMNLTIGASDQGASLGFLGQNSMASSNIGSVRSGRNIELRGLTRGFNREL